MPLPLKDFNAFLFPLQQNKLSTTGASTLTNYKLNNGSSLSSVVKSQSHFNQTGDSSSDDYFDGQTEITGTSLASRSEYAIDNNYSSHPMGRPRPRPENGINGLPQIPLHPPRRTRQNGVKQVRADVAPLSYENQNFRSTPSVGSTEYWDSPRLQSNGHAVKYNNNNNHNGGLPTHPSDLLRSGVSTASTFPLNPISTETLEDPNRSDDYHRPRKNFQMAAHSYGGDLDQPFEDFEQHLMSHRQSLPATAFFGDTPTSGDYQGRSSFGPSEMSSFLPESTLAHSPDDSPREDSDPSR